MEITVAETPPDSPEIIKLIALLDEYQNNLYPEEFNELDNIAELSRPNVIFASAQKGNTLIGCGAVKLINNQYGELKRFFVIPEARGLGAAGKILNFLESRAKSAGIKIIRLETGIHQSGAIGLYEKNGFCKIPPFGDYKENPYSVCMEKQLTR